MIALEIMFGKSRGFIIFGVFTFTYLNQEILLDKLITGATPAPNESVALWVVCGHYVDGTASKRKIHS